MTVKEIKKELKVVITNNKEVSNIQDFLNEANYHIEKRVQEQVQSLQGKFSAKSIKALIPVWTIELYKIIIEDYS